MWRLDLGHNSLNRNGIAGGATGISNGQWDGLTVYDLNSDGKAEIAIKTANGVTFGQDLKPGVYYIYVETSSCRSVQRLLKR